MAVAPIARTYFAINNVRPFYRGKIHEMAFYFTLVLLPATLYLCRDWAAHFLPILVYFASILCQYGVSAYYHQTIWRCPLAERKIQQLDHSCIFLLTAGSYTAQMTLVVPAMYHWEWSYQLLSIVWILGLCGIFKTMFLNVMPAIFDTLIYIGLGCACLPYATHICQAIHVRDLFLIIVGGLFYIIGGLIFALNSPNPWPKIF
eukprot:UN05653